MSGQDTALDNEVVGNDDIVVVSSVEEQAREQGWRPKDEFDGDPDSWVDAKEFLFRGELMGRIQSQGKYIKSQDRKLAEMQEGLRQLGEHNARIAEREYEKAIKSLREEKRRAIEDGDGATVVSIDEKIDELKADKVELSKRTATDNINTAKTSKEEEFNEVFHDWQSKPENTWYETDFIMQGAADAAGIAYIRENPNATPQDVLKHVSAVIRKEFKHKFKNTAAERSTVIEPDSTGTGTSRRFTKQKYSERDLSREQRKFADTFVNSGAFKSVQDYVDQLAELGELPAQRGE